MESVPQPDRSQPDDDTERIYRERVDCVPDWIWDIDTEGTYTFSNGVVESILGYTPAEIIGQKVFDFMAPEDATKCRAVLAEAVRTGSSVRNIVHRCFARDGNPKTLESSCVPITKDGYLAGFRGISRDIVDELIFQRAAREALANYRAVLDNAPTAVTVLQGDRVVYRNPKVYEQSNYTPEELSRTPPFHLVHPDDREFLRSLYERAMLGHAIPSEIQVRAVTKTGELRWLEVRATVITYNGAPAMLSNAVDCTERKRAEDEIRSTRDRLEKQQSACTDLAKRQVMAGADLRAALREITEVAARTTGVERLSAWRYTEERDRIICLDLYELSKDRHSEGEEVTVADHLAYFAAMEENRVVAQNALTAENTREFVNSYLQPHNITSMMDAAVRLRGQVVGMVCFEHTGPPRNWTPDEVNFAAAIANFAALSVEASNRAKAEEAVRESDARYKLLFEHSADMVAMLKDERFIAANRAYYTTLGYEPSEIIGLAPWDISPEFQPDGTPSDQMVRDHIARSLDAGPRTLDWVHRRKDGTLVDCELNVTAFRSNGEVYVQAIVRDITERKRAELDRLTLERHMEEQKRSFYRETILSVTGGKLDICEECDSAPYISSASVEIELRHVNDVPVSRHAVEMFLRKNGLTGKRLELFIAGAGEAVANAVKHGVEGRVYAGRADGVVWAAVTDRGKGIESLLLPRALLEGGFSTKPSLGMGYTIMLDVADRILLTTGEKGTTVVLLKATLGGPEGLDLTQRLAV